MVDSTMRDGRSAGVDTSVHDARRASATDERSAFNFNHDRQHHDDESIPGLLRELVQQGSHLAEQQVKLVEAEVRHGIGDLKAAVGAMAGAGVVAIAGLGVFLMAVSFLLGTAMPLWLATMIVAAATLAGAYAMYAAGQKKLQSTSLSVDRTKRTLERAPSALTGHKDHDHAR